MSEEKCKVLADDLKSILLANPFSRTGMDIFNNPNIESSEKEFFEHLYVPLLSARMT